MAKRLVAKGGREGEGKCRRKREFGEEMGESASVRGNFVQRRLFALLLLLPREKKKHLLLSLIWCVFFSIRPFFGFV